MIFQNDKQYTEEELLLMADAEDQSTGPQGLNELEKLNKRFGAKQPFLARWESFRKTWASPLSYICNIVSAIGIFYVFKVLFEVIPFAWIGILLAISCVAGYEIAKRRASDKLWDTWFITKNIDLRALLLNTGLFVASMAGTVYGTYWFILDNSPEAKYMGISDDPESTAIQNQIADLQKTRDAKQAELDQWREVNAVRSGQDKGQIKYKQLDTEKAKEEAILAIEEQVTSKEQLLESKFGIILVKNEDIQGMWETRNDTRMITGLLLCLLCEICFELLMAFMSKWDALRRAYLINRQRMAKDEGSTQSALRDYERQIKYLMEQLKEQQKGTPTPERVGKNGHPV